MARLNVLTGEAIATPPAPPPPVKRSSRKSKAQAPRAPKVSTLPGIIAAFPQSMFAFLKDTKGCRVYDEVEVEGQAPIVGRLYLKKYFAGQAERISLTLQKAA